MKKRQTRHRLTFRRAAALLFAILLVPQQVIAGQVTIPYKIDYSDNDINYYNPNACGTSATAPTAGSTDNGNYKKIGNIPLEGMDVGATTYGGEYVNGVWGPRNDQQGGPMPHDDNGMGNDGIPLAGRTAFAELGNGKALGGLPNGTKLEITYKKTGKTIIAEKDDVGAGGGPVNGLPRAVDLWWETADLLDFNEGSGPVHIRALKDGTVTPVGSKVQPDSPSACCGDSGVSTDVLTRFLQALAEQESGGKPHGPASSTGAHGKYQYIDSTWHGHAKDYYPPADKYAHADDAPEEVQDALTFIEYAVKFKKFKGDIFKLAVSHFQPAANDNPSMLDQLPPGNVITPRQYAQAMVQRINAGAGKDIPIKASQAPQFQEYLEKANADQGTVDAKTITCAGNGVAQGDVIRTGLGLAWPSEGHGKNKQDATPQYQTAMPKYNGATTIDPWSDCGVFVATVMVSSGVDPNYHRRGTSAMINYVRSHPEKYLIKEAGTINGTEDLEPGDILINNGHTFIFTGKYVGTDKKTYNAASASLHGHVPQASVWYYGFMVARVIK